MRLTILFGYDEADGPYGREVSRRSVLNADAADSIAFLFGGTLTLGRDMPAGAYVLQGSVGRLRRGQPDVIATQWSDFELQ